MNAVVGSGDPEDQRRAEQRFATRAFDTYSSSAIGGFLYLVAWLPVAYVTGLMARHPGAVFGISLVFLLLASLRLVSRPPTQVGVEQRRWFYRYLGILLVSVAIWGAVQVWIVFDNLIPPLAKSVSLFGTIAFCTVLAHLYASSLRLSVTGILLLLVPTVVSLWIVPGLHLLAIAMTFFAGYLATAIMRTRRDYQRRLELAEALLEQRDRYELLSWTDELTGLCNRRRFAETLNSQVRQLLSQPGPELILMLMDLDHFKLINDRHGHIIGDEALRSFADRLRAAFGDQGMLLARTGGEEFAVIVSTMSEEEALVRADAFRVALAAEPLLIAGLQVPLTVSIGIAAFDAGQHRNDDGLYGAVDVALYAAKLQGRNRVVSVSMLEAKGYGMSERPEMPPTKPPHVQESEGTCSN